MNSLFEIIAFLLIGSLTLGAAIAAVGLRDLVHCGLSLALFFVGVAGLYLLLGAEFIGFIQLLVYVGAVAVLIMFVILLTRPANESTKPPILSWRQLPGVLIAASVFLVLGVSILRSPSLLRHVPEPTQLSIQAVGEALVGGYLLPLMAIGVLLTAALIGAVLFALEGEDGK